MNISRNPIYAILTLALTSTAFITAQAQTAVVAKVVPAAAVSRSDTDTATVGSGYSPSNLNRVGVQTAQPVPLSLQEAILRALENNNDIEVSRDTVKIQETQIRSILGTYDPVFSVTPTYSKSQTNGSSPTHDFRVSSNFSQFIERGGGNYQVFFNNNRTENSFNQAQLTSGAVTGGASAIYSSSLGVTYRQPLFRDFKIDNTRRQLLIARRRLEQTDADFRLQAINTITQVQRAYWDFVFALRNQQNQIANLNLAKENLRQIEAKIEAGAAAPIERAETATELANREGDVLIATQTVATAENTLKGLLLRDPTSAEWASTFVPTDPPIVSSTPITLESALADAIANRFELKRLRLQQEINDEDIKYFKNQTKPQIDLNTTFSLNGFASGSTNSSTTTTLLTSQQDVFLLNSLNATRSALGLPLVTNPAVVIPASTNTYLFGGFNRSLANIFRTDAPNWSIGMTISFPFRNRTAKANLDAARITRNQIDAQMRAQEQTVVVSVRNAVQAIETTRQRSETTRRARENAELQLEGERRLYEAGRSTTFLLFQRENTLTNARNAEILAQTNYNKAVADLQAVTATAFQVNNIKVDAPVPIPPR